MPELTLSQGQIHYRDEGTGAPVLAVHGLPEFGGEALILKEV